MHVLFVLNNGIQNRNSLKAVCLNFVEVSRCETPVAQGKNKDSERPNITLKTRTCLIPTTTKKACTGMIITQRDRHTHIHTLKRILEKAEKSQEESKLVKTTKPLFFILLWRCHYERSRDFDLAWTVSRQPCGQRLLL